MQNQIMADKLLEKLFSDTENERKSVNQEILRLKEATRQMEQYLKNSTVNISQSATGAIASIEDDNMRRDIILEVISQIKLEQQDALHIKISIVPNLAIARDYPFYYVYDQSKRPYIRLLRYAFGKFDRDITSLIIERFHTPLSKGIRLAKEEKQRRIGEKVSIADIVEKYGYSYTTVYGFVRHGVLKGEMINRKVYIALEDAEAFFSKRNKGK
jgi:CHAT domain-containing protein